MSYTTCAKTLHISLSGTTCHLMRWVWMRLANWCVPAEALALGTPTRTLPFEPDIARLWVHPEPFDPGPCPKCGQRNYRINWVDLGFSTDFDEFIPGTVECMNPECEWGPGRVDDSQPGDTWVRKHGAG